MRLPERERKILTMTYRLEMSAGEIAEELGMTTETVWASLSRSRKTLKKYLEEGKYLKKSCQDFPDCAYIQ